jgi:flagellar biosynthesis anti-sigma factor FlgM
MVLDVRSLVPGQTQAMLGKTGKAEKKQSKKASSNSSAGSSDSVDLTGQAGQITRLINQMKSQPVLDPDRAGPVKEKIAKGEYEIEYEQVANKMLDFESSYYGY